MYYGDLSLDVAISALGKLKAWAIMDKMKSTDEEEREALTRQIQMYAEEERVIYFYADKHPALWNSVMDKINRLYNPIIKAKYEQSLSNDHSHDLTKEDTSLGIEDIKELFRKK